MSVSTELAAAAIGFAPEEIDHSASTRDLPLKWVVVIDDALPRGRAVNAAICVAAPTTARVRGLLGDDVVDADGQVHSGLPWLGCTVLSAPSERLGTLHAAAAARSDVAVSDMPAQGQQIRVYADYLSTISGTRAADLTYYAVSLVGPRKVINTLVKGLPLA